MDGIDLGLFDYDRHNTLYYFALNADEQIYFRYGGRTAESPTSRLSLESLEIALSRGLEQHRLYQQGALPASPRPEPYFPDQIPSLRAKVIDGGRCVECHLIADYELQERELAGSAVRVRQMYRSPDIAVLGLTLDLSRGLRVAEVEGAAAEGGILPGDVLTELEGTKVLTFGDLQYRFDKVERDRTAIRLGIDRAGTAVALEIDLPREWWATDLFFRYWTIEPQLYFSSKRLDGETKRRLGLPPEGFACEITFIEPRARALDHQQLETGDIIYAVNGVEISPWTTSCERHLKLETVAGAASTLGVLRQGERVEMPLRSGRQNFRKLATKPGALSGAAR